MSSAYLSRPVLRQAQAAQFAAVWLWRVADWAPAGQPLEAHSLTVTQMAFSSTGQHLLTVSRDRTFAVWERQTAGETLSALCLKVRNGSVGNGCVWSALVPRLTQYVQISMSQESIHLWQMTKGKGLSCSIRGAGTASFVEAHLSC